ncbi:hypothetical protein [Brevundimonas sp. AAP58]|uniref:hypothetical protein n=1 Tax=Brevundimonas sp. AAP58 TaxID=1523422 RepID=UPI0012E18DE7|nr:hypothetical protein [Brevundimonas sp. AAP58]
MTHMLTINFNRLDVSEDQVSSLFREVRLRVARAWRYARLRDELLGTFDYFHVQDNPNSKTNVHWALHIPPGRGLWFEKLVLDRLAKLIGSNLDSDAVKMTTVTTPGGMAKYMLKGANPMFASHFHMSDWVANRGTVIGRRFGTSRSLGRTARKANWVRKASTS